MSVISDQVSFPVLISISFQPRYRQLPYKGNARPTTGSWTIQLYLRAPCTTQLWCKSLNDDRDTICKTPSSISDQIWDILQYSATEGKPNFLRTHCNGVINVPDGVSNHRRLYRLLKRLFRRRSMKTSKLHGTGLCKGNSPVISPHKVPVTGKTLPFDDVIMRVRAWHIF